MKQPSKHSTAWYKQQTDKIKREVEAAITTYCLIRFDTLNLKLENRRRKQYL